MEPLPNLYLRQLQLGQMANFVYLVGAEGAKEVAVVDPGWDAPAIEEALSQDGKELSCIIFTHAHPDHVNAVGEVLGRHPVPVYLQRAEVKVAPWLEELGSSLRLTEPDQELMVGPLKVKLLNTPGHSPGSQCLLAEGALITGDTLFVNSCGRVDLPGGNPEAMFRSLQQLGGLPPQTRVYPGHDYGDVKVSTVGRELKNNPYFQFKDLQGFLAFR